MVVTVWIPSLMRDLTHGEHEVMVEARSVREVVARLDVLFPGIAARLVNENRLRPGLMLVVDGASSNEGLRYVLEPGSEVHFVPAMSGGISLNP